MKQAGQGHAAGAVRAAGAPPDVQVIIGTTCTRARRFLLRRAIASVLEQRGVEVEVLLVVNGPRRDARTLQHVSADPRVRVYSLPEPDFAAALHAGRCQVTAPFFSFLDDDDEYLPGALSTRLSSIGRDGPWDVVVTDGLVRGRRCLSPGDLDRIGHDPLRALVQRNWLASCAGLFRTSAVPPRLFERLPRYFEWSLLGFRLAVAGFRIRALDMVTYRVHQTEVSESNSRDYEFSAVGPIDEMLSVKTLPPDVRRRLKKKRAEAWHTMAHLCLGEGRLGDAWRYHCRSIRHIAGIKYLAYTRHFLRRESQVRRRRRTSAGDGGTSGYQECA